MDREERVSKETTINIIAHRIVGEVIAAAVEGRNVYYCHVNLDHFGGLMSKLVKMCEDCEFRVNTNPDKSVNITIDWS